MKQQYEEFTPNEIFQALTDEELDQLTHKYLSTSVVDLKQKAGVMGHTAFIVGLAEAYGVLIQMQSEAVEMLMKDHRVPKLEMVTPPIRLIANPYLAFECLAISDFDRLCWQYLGEGFDYQKDVLWDIVGYIVNIARRRGVLDDMVAEASDILMHYPSGGHYSVKSYRDQLNFTRGSWGP